jgi:PAS domain-containing protein
MDNEEKIRKEIGPVDKKVSLLSVEFLLSPWAIATLTFTIFISLILIGCSFVQDLQEQSAAIESSSRPLFEKTVKGYEPFLVLAGSVLVSILTALVSFVLASNKEKAAALVRANKKLLSAMEEQQAIARELSDTRLRTERILESITGAFYTLNREWRFTYVNKEAENLLCRERSNLLGKVVWENLRRLSEPPFIVNSIGRSRKTQQ